MNMNTGSSDLVARLVQTGRTIPCNQLDGDFLPLPSGALESVIVGCEAPVSAVARIVREFDPGLTIKRMVRAPNRYKLEMEEVVL
jgi:hypothetical protein